MNGRRITVMGLMMIRRLRVKYAAKFGKIEHKAGRYIALPIIASIILGYYKKGYPELILSVLTLIIWLVYLFSHNVEKKLYGHYGPRG